MSVLMQLDFEAARAEKLLAGGRAADPVGAAYEACLDLANCLDDVAKTRDVPAMLGAAVRCVAEWLRRGGSDAKTAW